MKVHTIGSISMTKEGYAKFTKKSKKEQLEEVYNSLYPKSYPEAEKLLKNVPNGDISKGNAETATGDNTTNNKGGSGGLSTAKSTGKGGEA